MDKPQFDIATKMSNNNSLNILSKTTAKSKPKTKKVALASIFLIAVMALMIAFPKICISSIYNGLSVWAKCVLPSLLPFMFFTKLLTKLDFVSGISKKFYRINSALFKAPKISGYIFLMSIISGYPVGAKMISEFYKMGVISTDEANKLCTFCSTSGPLFVIGSVGTAMFGSAKIGYIMFASHFLSCFANGILYRNCFACGKDAHGSEKCKGLKHFGRESANKKSKNASENDFSKTSIGVLPCTLHLPKNESETRLKKQDFSLQKSFEATRNLSDNKDALNEKKDGSNEKKDQLNMQKDELNQQQGELNERKSELNSKKNELNGKKDDLNKRNLPSQNILSESMKDTILSVLIVAGFIAIAFLIVDLFDKLNLFAPINNLLTALGVDGRTARAISSGVVEMSKGCVLLSTLGLPLKVTSTIASFLIGFGGICTFLQATSFLKDANVNLKFYILQKFTQGIFGATINFLLCMLFAV